MKRTFFSLILLLSFVFSMAQEGNPEQQEAMQKLRWMIGNWAGSSIVNIGDQKQLTNIRESIQSGLDGTILTINVIATDKDSNTRRQLLAYTSFSVISYDLKNKSYRWTSWRNSEKYYDEYSFSVDNNSFEYISNENGGKVRYKAKLGSDGEFLETGEYSKDGSSWGEFITMKLRKGRR